MDGAGLMSSAIITPLNSLKRWDTGADFSPSSATCLDDFAGSSIVATGSSAANAFSMSGSRLGEPLVTDSTTKAVIQVQYSTGVGEHFVMAGANLPSSATVSLYQNHTGNPAQKVGEAVYCSPNGLWIFYGDITGTGSDKWSIEIDLSSAQTIEIPFIGFGGFDRGNADNLDAVGAGFFQNGTIVSDWVMRPVKQTTEVGGRAGNTWTRRQPNTYEQTVILNGTHYDGDGGDVNTVYDDLEESEFSEPVLTIMNAEDPNDYGACCFGRLTDLSGYPEGARGPSWQMRFTLEQAR